jgi:hypothetical protein
VPYGPAKLQNRRRFRIGPLVDLTVFSGTLAIQSEFREEKPRVSSGTQANLGPFGIAISGQASANNATTLE